MAGRAKFPYSLSMSTRAKRTSELPDWVSTMEPGYWCRISGSAPDLGLPPTAVGTRYLEDNDPARDPALNPPMSLTERTRRQLGREWIAPWRGRVGFSSITDAWNGAVYASRFGQSGAMIVFGGGHNDYFGSDVHAFDVAQPVSITVRCHCICPELAKQAACAASKTQRARCVLHFTLASSD